MEHILGAVLLRSVWATASSTILASFVVVEKTLFQTVLRALCHVHTPMESLSHAMQVSFSHLHNCYGQFFLSFWVIRIVLCQLSAVTCSQWLKWNKKWLQNGWTPVSVINIYKLQSSHTIYSVRINFVCAFLSSVITETHIWLIWMVNFCVFIFSHHWNTHLTYLDDHQKLTIQIYALCT